MRGKALVQCASSSPPGITPAYAGKSRGQSRNCTNTEDHPRVCGEKAKAFYMKPLEEGSPPRMRGKAIRRDGCIGLRRDHPRVCGEKYQLGVVKPLHEGSPPRMRGKAYKGADQTTRRGITPAYAGKSTGDATDEETFGDHPRVCGEKLVDIGQTLGLAGSPPRMRGKGERKTGKTRRVGITPAYAGKRIACNCV